MSCCEDRSEIYRQVRFKPGDVVRSKDEGGQHFGVVVMVDQYWDDPPRYQLYVDAAPEGGIGVWSVESAVLSNDPESVAEARRLGLRGLPPEDVTAAEDPSG